MTDRIQWPDEACAAVVALVGRLGYRDLKPYAELSGASGARTFLCQPESFDGRPIRLVLKIGPAEVLAADLAGLRRARTHFRGADYALTNEITVDGHTCIPLRLAGSDVETFEEFYRRARTPDEVIAVIDELFGDVLRQAELTVHAVASNALSQYTIDEAMARRLSMAGDDVPGLLNWWRHVRQTEQRGSYSRLCHGDLHGRNVLISQEPPFVHVIDFSHTDRHHALRDLAKLEREIHLTLLGGAHAGRWTSAVLGYAPAEVDDPELVKASVVIARLRELARSHLPVDADVEFEYGIALLAQFMFAAGNDRLPATRRRDALAAARLLQAGIVDRSPSLALPSEEHARQRRQEVLWRFAYTFLRLDQLPGGGWGRSLPGWMEAIWAGAGDQVTRNPKMRREGGTDLTAYAMGGLVAFLGDHLSERDRAEVLLHNDVLSRAYYTLRGKVDYQGASGTEHPGYAHAAVKIRHTAMTVLAALRLRIGHDRGVSAIQVLRSCLEYLEGHLKYWARDTAHPFGMAMACAKLTELLQTDLIDPVDPELVDRVLAELDTALPAMLEALENEDRAVDYVPVPPARSTPRAPFFHPYCNFWRLERSGFLMYMGLAVTENGTGLIEPVGRALRPRLIQCFDQLLTDVAIPFDPAQPAASLIFYHRGGEGGADRDWGLSAEFAALLEVPAVVDAISRGNAATRRELEAKRFALHQALLATFDGFLHTPRLFTYTQSPSFLQSARVLATVTPTRGAIEAIDTRIDDLRRDGMTEWHLDRFIRDLVVQSCGADGSVNVPSLCALLVAKLESGEYIEDDTAWERMAECARALADSPVDGMASGQDEHSAARELRSMLADVRSDGRAFSLGDPVYERLLRELNFEVVSAVTPMDLSVMDSGKFDVVVAGTAIMHIPLPRARRLYSEFFGMLRPGGLLVISIKVGDNSLIALDGRFVQYYRNEAVLRAMLDEAGFGIEKVRYSELSDGKAGKWMHFFGRKRNA